MTQKNDRVVQMELLPSEGALTRLSDSAESAMFRTSVEIAKQYPRDIVKVTQTLLATLDAFPQFAEKALYSIPYEDRKKGRVVKVEGMSIRAAETIASEWGNIRIGVRITGEDDNGFDLEAVAHDMQSNNVSLLPARVSRLTKVGGTFVMMDPDRMRMALNAAISKLKRNVTMSVIPLQVKAAYEKKVRELLAGGDLNKLADGKRVTQALTSFKADFNVEQARLEVYIGKPLSAWLGSDLADLRALYNALEDGETTVAESLPPIEEKKEPASPTAGAVVTESAEGHLGSAAREPEKKEEPKKEEPPAKAEAPATGSPDDALLTEIAQEIEACTTKEQFDALLGRLYAPGGKIEKAPRPVKRSVIAKVNAKRDKLQAK